MNNEFSSTNGEGEPSPEERQALNVASNARRQNALERHHSAADDLQNLLCTANLAALFLDEDLRIRYFASSAGLIFNIVASDVGRSLADLADPLPGVDLLADAREVLDKLTPLRREVRSGESAWYRCVIAPYRTRDNRIQGVVVTLGDISELKTLGQQAEIADAYVEAIIETTREPLVLLDEAMRVISASRSFCAYFQAAPADTIGRLLPDIGAHYLDLPALRAFLDNVRDGDGGRQSCEIELELPALPQGGRRTLIVSAAKVRDSGASGQRILAILNGITEYRHPEQRHGTVGPAERPARLDESLTRAAEPLQRDATIGGYSVWRRAAAMRIAALTHREREVLDLVVTGHANKEIAARLGIGQRTVESHRARVMGKMGAASLSELVRLVLAAEQYPAPAEGKPRGRG